MGVADQPGIAAKIFDPLADNGISVDVIVQNASVSGTTDLTFTVKSPDLDSAMDVVQAVSKDLGIKDVGHSTGLAKVSIVGTGMQDSPGYAAKMFSSLSESGINIEMITTSEIRITCLVKEEVTADAAKALHEAFELDKTK